VTLLSTDYKSHKIFYYDNLKWEAVEGVEIEKITGQRN